MMRSASARTARIAIRFAQLMHQVIVQRLGLCSHVGDRVVPSLIRLFVHPVQGPARRLVEVIGDLAVQIDQPLEILGWFLW